MSSYAKLFSSITESSLWSEPKEVRLLFVSMLARADATGFVEAALPGLARLANLTIPEVEAAIAVLEAPDPHSKNPEYEGRRLHKAPGGWMLLNYEDYRNRRGEEDRREYMRKYMSDYRRKHGVNNSANSKHDVSPGKPPLAQAEAEAEAEAEVEAINVANADVIVSVLQRWNSIEGVGHCRKLTAKRRQTILQRLKDPAWLEDFAAALPLIEGSAFLKGAGSTGWKADFDWLLKPDSLTKVLEGKYDSGGSPRPDAVKQQSQWRELKPPSQPAVERSVTV